MKLEYRQFDYYKTDLSFVSANHEENYLKFSDYGITKDDIYKYRSQIEKAREHFENKHITISHWRTVALCVVAVLTLLFFLEFIGYYNDFMKKIGLFYDIILTPSYILFIWLSYKYVFGIGQDIVYSFSDRIEDDIKFPVDGHPEYYNQAIEKYFNDLLWKLYIEKSENPNRDSLFI